MNTPERDYPQPATERGRVEPCPRRVRGYAGGELVFDTLGARYVWEIPYYPHYYVPVGDVSTQVLVDDQHSQRAQFGAFRTHSLHAGGQVHTAAARVFDEGDGLVPGLVRFEWDSVEWFEEDERIYGHPRSPYARLDALRSHRHVRVELDGAVLAETRSPVLLFETGLPTRYYIDPTDVSMQYLQPSRTQTTCPYKGVTSAYWSVHVGDAVHADLAWMYQYPLGAVARIAGLVAFYNEKVDIVVDGVRLPRPVTHMS
ncbi:DUF427 domain-containing protein [Mycobacterium sp. ITM-2016-00316]|uniref:DUF427 domain-containing protein n=1 Tax=Mycobacterium sp. ITM-2016-00316 TaxID=2099695 RepID=UPI000CF8E5B9|nr:DUF427 domain-containing protein [Mycobacterium sp. ITM-2016-00316]WNG80911.1 DUF427 domain-containing protein [Mycobacterium sp. ITM-2016-00316]